MQDFSEEELLLLSNYVYFNCSTNKGTIGENIDLLKNEGGTFDIQKIMRQGAVSCNISEEEAVKLLTHIDENQRLRNLSSVRQLEERDIRGVCYFDTNAKKACVVFRGTGGTYEAWDDNVRGEYQADTKLQRIAGDFVKDECGEFNNITVTGHSKGGNLAQYVTVTCNNKINRCVSFDGQGFGKDFLLKYKDEIKIASPKITSICAYNDYVNILLTGIAGATLYMKNKGTGIDGHSSFSLYDSIKFTDEGKIDRLKSCMFQGLVAKKLEKSLDTAVSIIDFLPGEGREKASNVIGSVVAGLMSNDMGEEYERERISRSLEEFKKYAGQLIGISNEKPESVNVVYEKSSYTGNTMINTAYIMQESSGKIVDLAERTQEAQRAENINIAARYFIDKSLEKICDRLYRISDLLRKHGEVLFGIYRIYEEDETKLLQMLSHSQ